MLTTRHLSITPHPSLSCPRLTVTDLDSAQSVAYVNVTVLPESDYPPTANAGNPSLIHLPKNEVYLDGKGSTDDKVRWAHCMASKACVCVRVCVCV